MLADAVPDLADVHVKVGRLVHAALGYDVSLADLMLNL